MGDGGLNQIRLAITINVLCETAEKLVQVYEVVADIDRPSREQRLVEQQEK